MVDRVSIFPKNEQDLQRVPESVSSHAFKYVSSEVSSSSCARPKLKNSGWMDVPSGKFANSPFASVLMC